MRFTVWATSYGYAVRWGPDPSGDTTAMIHADTDGLLGCVRCNSAVCAHVQAAIEHRAKKAASE